MRLLQIFCSFSRSCTFGRRTNARKAETILSEHNNKKRTHFQFVQNLYMVCSQVWVGQSGSAQVQCLESSASPRGLSPDFYDQDNAVTVSIFFDSSGRLQQVSDRVQVGNRDGGGGERRGLEYYR